MAYIETSIPPMKVFVRRRFFNNDADDYGYERAVLISARCLEGSAVLFQVLTETGRMRDKLPISAFCWKIPDFEDVWDDFPFHSLQLWDCFSRDFTVVQLAYVYNCRVSVLMKNRKTLEGQYQWTIQWAGNTNAGGADITLAEDGSEHKSHHFIKLENGLFALQPNNRITKWHEPSFCTKPVDPDELPWEVNQEEYCCEQHEKWATENSQSYFYGLAKKMEEEGTLPEIPETVSFVSFERDISNPPGEPKEIKTPEGIPSGVYLKDEKSYNSREEAMLVQYEAVPGPRYTIGPFQVDAAGMEPHSGGSKIQDIMPIWNPTKDKRHYGFNLSPAAQELSDKLRELDRGTKAQDTPDSHPKPPQ